MDVLVQLVPQLMQRIDTLEGEVKGLKESKEVMGQAIVKLVKKVKKMEGIMKRRKLVLTESDGEEDENSSKQGRNMKKGLDELVALEKKKTYEEVFATPTQSKSSGEATNISPGGMEAATILQQVSSSTGNIETYRRRRGEAVAESPKDFFSAAKEKIASTSPKDLTSKAIQREGKAIAFEVESPQQVRTKEQILQEEASLREIARIKAAERLR